jgi:hypothetical protein
MAKSEKNLIKINKSGPGGGVFLVTYIGAAVHFVQQADGFWEVILALLKGLVWPAFLIHRVFDLLKI